LNEPRFKSESIALAGLALCAVAENNIEVAKDLVATIKSQYPTELKLPFVAKGISSVELAIQASSTNVSFDELIAKVKQNPDDLDSCFNLAVAYHSAGKSELAIDELLKLIKRNKTWQESKAKTMLQQIFEALGPTNELTKSGRKKFSNVWFS